MSLLAVYRKFRLNIQSLHTYISTSFGNFVMHLPETRAIYMITSPTVTPATVTRPDRCFGTSTTFRLRREAPPPPPPVVSPLPYSNNHFFVKLLLDMTLLRNEWASGFVPATVGTAVGVEFGVMKDSSGRRWCEEGGAIVVEVGGKVGTLGG